MTKPPELPTPDMIPSPSDLDWRTINVGAGEGIPPYLDPLLDPSIRDEARRAWVLSLLLDSNHCLLPTWRTEVPGLESYLKDGTLPATATVHSTRKSN